MKKYILSTIFLGIVSTVFAQDPQVSAPNVMPSPALVNGPIIVSMNFQNADTEPITNPDPSNNMTVIGITLNKIKPTLDVNGNPDVTGAGASYFTWSASCNGTCATDGSSDATDVWEISGLQNQEIPGMPDPFTTIGGPINVAGKVTSASTVAESQGKNGSGFIVNITPGAGGDVDLSAASNSAENYTFTNGVLPVKLVSFDGHKEGNSVALRWATTEEINSDYFEIQYSVTGKQWMSLGNVLSHGESATLKNYTFSHRNPTNGENLYRLKMIDKDATFAYSRIRSVKFEGQTSDLSVYPNPVTDKLFIRDYTKVTQVKILDMNGRSVYHTAEISTGEVNVKNLVTGIYVVNIIRLDGVQSSQKIVISR